MHKYYPAKEANRQIDAEALNHDNYSPNHHLRFNALTEILNKYQFKHIIDPAAARAWCQRCLTYQPETNIVSDLHPLHKELIDQMPERGIFTEVLCAPLEEVIEKYNSECIILTEILEHVADPDRLVKLSLKYEWILASSPIVEENEEDTNPWHLHAWNIEGYEDLFKRNGWEIVEKINQVPPPPYNIWPIQIVLAKRKSS